MSEAGRTSVVVKRVLATMVVAMVIVFLVDLVAGPVFSFSTQAWPPARQGDKLIGGIRGVVKATDPAANTVRISSGFLGLGSLLVVVTPETTIAVNGKFGGFGDLDRGQGVRVTYEVHPDRLVAARLEVLDRSSDASEARLPSEQSSEAMVPSLAPSAVPLTPVPPGTTTSSSPRVTSPAPVPKRGAVPASPPKRSVRPPTSAPSRSAQQPKRATPSPVTSMRPTRPPAAPGAPQDAQDAVRPARRPATARTPQTPDVLRSGAAPDPGVQRLTTPDAKHEATALAPVVSAPEPPPPSVSPPPAPPSVSAPPHPPLASMPPTTARETPKSGPQSAPAEAALVDKIRNDWEAIKREARRGGDEWRDGWRRLQRLFTD
jgi:hypothetical protein